LLHSFLSPLANKRNDEYGGDINGRMKLLLQVVDAVRDVIPENMPLFCRISAVDGLENGWEIEDSVILAKKLEEHGVDVVDCSAGGISGAPLFRVNKLGKPMKTNMDRGPGFQVPYADKVKNEAGIKTMAVGVIVDPNQAEKILQEEKADLIAVGRELMYNPFWTLHAAQALNADPEFSMWPEQYKWGVNRRGKLAEFKGIRDEVIEEDMVVSHLSDINSQK
jgi:2,4-dienoyl-CoA reductase-like NADH-dependent reductase (Old Yellow Enzyme family)